MPDERGVLVHACCAPCLTQTLSVLGGLDGWERALEEEPPGGRIGVWFYNPNLEKDENARREAEVRRLLALSPFLGLNAVPVEHARDMDADREEWKRAVRGLENEPEKGARCAVCYVFRLERAFETARVFGFSSVVTSLTLSPMKDAKKIDAIGRSLSGRTGVRWLSSDFKKNEGFKKSVAFSKELGLYRQDWCGCRYSEAASRKRRAEAPE
jgi:hypothetical protein